MRHCANCGTFEWVSDHHIKFVSQGGDNRPGNKIPLCFWCHQKPHGVGNCKENGKRVTGRVWMIRLLQKLDLRIYDDVLAWLRRKDGTHT